MIGGDLIPSLPFAMLAQQDAAAAPMQSPAVIGFWIILLAVMALMPFLFTMVTSFAKLVIVGGIIRQALGTQQIPPNTVITGLALILTIHIMWPVGEEAYVAYTQRQAQQAADPAAADADAADSPARTVSDIVSSVEPPIRRFLEKHAHPRNVVFFENLQQKLRAGGAQARGTPDAGAAPAIFADNPQMLQLMRDLSILAPAFMLSELIEAFQIGFLIFVPFLVIDLVVSNILLAMGMHMLSPVTVSMPFKLLLFVLVDGWTMIIQGVVLGYV